MRSLVIDIWHPRPLAFELYSYVPCIIFRIVADRDLDFSVQARHQTKKSQNRSLHWTHASAVKNTVNHDCSLSFDKCWITVTALEMTHILSSMTRKRFIMIWFHLYTEKLFNTSHVIHLSSLVSSTTYHTPIQKKWQRNQSRQGSSLIITKLHTAELHYLVSPCEIQELRNSKKCKATGCKLLRKKG